MQTAFRHHTKAQRPAPSLHGARRHTVPGIMSKPAGRAQLQQTRAFDFGLDPETVQNGTYWVLGAAGASFVGTFFVAPQFKQYFKEDLEWRDIYAALTATSVNPIAATEAYNKCKSGGAVLVDVRLINKYEKSHAANSLSIPLYIPIQAWDVASVIRRMGFAFFGIYGTELNQDFANDVANRIPKGKQVIVICENGGSLENKSGTKYGFQSRSLKAIYFLQQAGFKNVSYVKGGISQWARDKLPLASGEEDVSAVDLNDDGDEDANTGLKVGGLRLPQLTNVFSRR